ncbi:MAG TPA: ABC transporter permease [Bryobacteraceae bacterium]|jgi:putative ABC transport system permease protein|nr:ABC transporter permease [Bryobacteraceae bacterium]
MNTVLQDVRYAFRIFLRNPGFTVICLLILAIGVGASASIFSVVDGVIIKPLPYRDPNQLVRVYGAWSQGAREGISPPDFIDYRAQNKVFESLACESNFSPIMNLSGIDRPQQLQGRYISAGFFKTLGIHLLAGREFQVGDEAWKGPKVVILSNELWNSLFGRDPSIVGRQITMNSALYTIVGVLPPFFDMAGRSQIYFPLQENILAMRGFRSQIVIGRLAPGVSVARAQAEMNGIARGLEQAYPNLNRTWRVVVLPLSEEVVKNSRPALLILLVSAGFVVLIIAANVANLMLAQITSRRTEVAVRLSLGSSKFRLTRQLVTEGTVLALLGALLGCAVAVGCTSLVRSLGPATIPRLSEISVDGRVLVFAIAVSVGMGIFFGAAPVFRFAGMPLGESLKQGSRSIGSGLGALQTGLIVAEVALSVVLVVGAGLLIRSLQQLQRVDPGFRTDHLLITRISLPFNKYSTDQLLEGFWRDALRRIRDIPGVRNVGFTSELPLSGLNNPTPFKANTAAGRPYVTFVRSISPDYPAVMNIPLRAGRYFTANDRDGTPNVMLINQAFAHDVFGNEDPIGKHLTFQFDGPYEGVIVGVIGNVHHTSLAADPFREVYLPLEQSTLLAYHLVVRTEGDPKAFVSQVRAAIWAIDRDQAVGSFSTMGEIIHQGLIQQRFRSLVLGLFSAIAMAVSAIGLYGVLSYLVSQRTREIGIRLAMGASRGQILNLIVGKAMRLTGIGLLLGGLCALAFTRLLTQLLFGVGTVDPAAFSASFVLPAAIALLASYMPARRASLVDPVRALRNE